MASLAVALRLAPLLAAVRDLALRHRPVVAGPGVRPPGDTQLDLTQNSQGLSNFWVNFRPLIGIFSQNAGPTGELWAIQYVV